MRRFLLDTNVISIIVRDPRGTVAGRLAGMPSTSLCTSIVVAAELRYGAIKKQSARLSRSLDEVFLGIDILPFQSPADETCAMLRARLEAAGTPLHANDLLVAAHALAEGCVLVTDDRAFLRVHELTVENWLR